MLQPYCTIRLRQSTFKITYARLCLKSDRTMSYCWLDVLNQVLHLDLLEWVAI